MKLDTDSYKNIQEHTKEIRSSCEKICEQIDKSTRILSMSKKLIESSDKHILSELDLSLIRGD